MSFINDDVEWAEKTAKFDAEYAAVKARVDSKMQEIQEEIAADTQSQAIAAVERVFNDESSATDMAVRNITMSAIMNAPTMSFAELEHFPVLQVKIFEYEYFEGKPNVKATDELNHDLESFMYENNLSRVNIADYHVAIEPGKMTPFGKSYPNLYLRVILTYWKAGKITPIE